MPSIIVPDGYQYVLAAAAATLPLTMFQTIKVGRARKAAGVKYPAVYAETAQAAVDPKAMAFNCTQRAHQNTLEITPHYILGTLVTGLKHPQLAVGLGAAWVVGRILYTIGYSTGNPDNRNTRGGFLSSLSIMGLICATSYTVFEFVKEGL